MKKKENDWTNVWIKEIMNRINEWMSEWMTKMSLMYEQPFEIYHWFIETKAVSTLEQKQQQHQLYYSRIQNPFYILTFKFKVPFSDDNKVKSTTTIN